MKPVKTSTQTRLTALSLALALCLPLLAASQAGAIISYAYQGGQIFDTVDAQETKTWTMDNGPCSAVWQVNALKISSGKLIVQKRLNNGTTGVKTRFFSQLTPGQEPVEIRENEVVSITVTVDSGKVRIAGVCQEQ